MTDKMLQLEGVNVLRKYYVYLSLFNHTVPVCIIYFVFLRIGYIIGSIVGTKLHFNTNKYVNSLLMGKTLFTLFLLDLNLIIRMNL